MIKQSLALSSCNPQYAAAYAAAVYASVYFKEICFTNEFQRQKLLLNYRSMSHRAIGGMEDDVAALVDSCLEDSSCSDLRCEARVRWCGDESLELSLSTGFEEYVFAFPRQRRYWTGNKVSRKVKLEGTAV